MDNLPIPNQTVTKLGALTARQEMFAVAYASGMQASDAYRASYQCDDSSRATVRVNASRLLAHPRVADRIRALQEAAGARSLRSTQALVADLEESAYADPNELVTLLNGACRYCWSDGHKHAWRSVDEYVTHLEAVQQHNDALPPGTADHMRKPLPEIDGGFSYSFTREPNPDCPECLGAGINRVRFNSSQDVSDGARRLLRGVETYPDGSLKRLHLHDQLAMRTELHRLRGLHVDRSVNVNVNANVPAFEGMSRADQLAFLESLKP